MIQNVLFDIGQVLLLFDFKPVESWIRAHCTYQEDDLETRIRSHVASMERGEISGNAFLEKLRQDAGFTGEREEFLSRWNGIFRPNLPMWAIAESLSSLGKRMHLFSNTNDFHMNHFMSEFDIFRRCFDGGIFSQQVGCMKPDAGFFQAGVDKLGVKPEATLYIDDSAENVNAGRAFGFHSLQYDHTDHGSFESSLGDLEIKF